MPPSAHDVDHQHHILDKDHDVATGGLEAEELAAMRAQQSVPPHTPFLTIQSTTTGGGRLTVWGSFWRGRFSFYSPCSLESQCSTHWRVGSGLR